MSRRFPPVWCSGVSIWLQCCRLFRVQSLIRTSAKLGGCLRVLNKNTVTLRLCGLKPGAFMPLRTTLGLFVCSVQPEMVQTLLESVWKCLFFPPPRCEKMTSQAKTFWLDTIYTVAVWMAAKLQVSQCHWVNNNVFPAKGSSAAIGRVLLGEVFILCTNPAWLAKPCPCTVTPSTITIHKRLVYFILLFFTVLL